MTPHSGLHLTGLSDDLMIDLLEAFSSRKGWFELDHYQQIADKIIEHYLTVQFHSFVCQQISH